MFNKQGHKRAEENGFTLEEQEESFGDEPRPVRDCTQGSGETKSSAFAGNTRLWRLTTIIVRLGGLI